MLLPSTPSRPESRKLLFVQRVSIMLRFHSRGTGMGRYDDKADVPEGVEAVRIVLSEAQLRAILEGRTISRRQMLVDRLLRVPRKVARAFRAMRVSRITDGQIELMPEDERSADSARRRRSGGKRE
ncbi:hypothetical protein [Burkholderia dolosa]|uniref:hypothetical protein n=1 Tax=Burkholderia dolosa TaxID=152500 RepID=UPI001BABBD77|nr:hypothetical protein [Burkholderia dolosa]MDN7423801.1 hypothetical protein [Burkholderia dolosa]